MTKVASKPTAAPRTPAKPPAKPPSTGTASKVSPVQTSTKKDGGTLSAEAKNGSNGNVGGLISGLQSWGNEPTADTAKAKEAKPLELGEGQFLRKGASGDKVTQLQEMLNSKGAKLDVDGKFGSDTLAALKKFQGDSELGTDGIVGPKTLEKLNGSVSEAKADAGGAKPADPADNAKDPKEAADKGKEVKPLELGDGQTLRKGMSGDKVTQLQEMLNSKGAKLDTDGKFGPDTLAALKKFQGENELGKDGVVGPKTLEKLNGAAPEGKTDNQAVDQAGQADKTGQTDQAAGQGRFKDTRASLDSLPEPLKKYADVFQAAGEKYGVDPRFLASIAMHETGNGTSSAFRNKNNAMGISNRSGPIRMSSVEASINKMAEGLAKPNGYYKGKTTIGAIGKVYAPGGAANDPTGLNAHWAGGVARNYRNFGGDPSGQVVFR